MSAFVLKLIKPICSFLSYHPQLDLLSRKVRAFPMSSVHAMLADPVQRHLDAMPPAELRRQVKTMARAAREHGMETCAAAMEDALVATGQTSPADVEMTAARISCAGRMPAPDAGGKLLAYDKPMNRKKASNG